MEGKEETRVNRRRKMTASAKRETRASKVSMSSINIVGNL